MSPRPANKMFERFIGALVVCSIIYILYSILLESRSEYLIDRSTEIPLRIESLDSGQFERDRSELQLPPSTPELFNPVIEIDSEDIEDIPVIDESGQPNGWVIQVGSFSQKEKADEIVNGLVSEGLKAYQLDIQSGENSESLHRVLVGPYLSAEYATSDQKKVNELLQVESILLKFEP